MKLPYTLYNNHKEVKLNRPSQAPPGWCRYHLPFAQEKWLLKLDDLHLFSQQFMHRPFFIDLIQVQANASRYIPFLIHDRQLYMYFMLEGDLIFTTENKKPIIKVQSNTFFMSYYDEGSYFAYIEKGKYIALVLNIHPEWIKSINGTFVNIHSILQRFAHGKQPYENMSHCRIDRKTQRWLYKIYSYSQDNKGALDGNLRKYISFLLEYYDGVLGDRDNDMALKIKSFIDENYPNTELNIAYLADHFHMTARTLLNTFKRRYHLTLQQYLSDLRIGKALTYIAEEGMPIKDVYMKVGYADERTFRYALERYQKRNK